MIAHFLAYGTSSKTWVVAIVGQFWQEKTENLLTMATKEINSLLSLLEILPSNITNKSKDYSVEICIDSVESAKIASLAGANRVELCSSLLEGGLTPSIGTIIQVLRSAPNIDVHVMMRPRSGDFLYNPTEMGIILSDIEAIIGLKESGKYSNLKGIVSGFLDKNGDVDVKNLSLCLNKIKNKQLEFTFHRAIDMSRDAIKSLDICIKYGVDRVLTSGSEINVETGLKCILEMVEYAKENESDIIIAVGGGINLENIGNIVNDKNKGIKHIHGTFRSVKKGGMVYQKSNIYMGASSVNGTKMCEYENKYANIDIIKQIVSYMNKSCS